MKESEENQKGVSIEDFVSVHKVKAFCRTFSPVEDEMPDVEVFNDAKLRKYFQAYPRGIGDPLNWYLEALSMNGFIMTTSLQNEPAILARRKTDGPKHLMLEDAFGTDDSGTGESLI